MISVLVMLDDQRVNQHDRSMWIPVALMTRPTGLQESLQGLDGMLFNRRCGAPLAVLFPNDVRVGWDHNGRRTPLLQVCFKSLTI